MVPEGLFIEWKSEQSQKVKIRRRRDVVPSYHPAPSHLIPAPDEVQTLTDIQQTGRLSVHCAADKIFKWSKLG
ncbi:hypothetical protein NECAME_10940 [Necator americanus]|uniref:Uncharacterized protein n=1 Tax=Necator americanus TaxID=51031 RepID=W2T8R4_NECAM|nr:hypothetical protein NECAME_10940 [Necator americanus]ETN77591.1 hypothetical protein NECAME_10940 [Necator americanus]